MADTGPRGAPPFGHGHRRCCTRVPVGNRLFPTPAI
jgi:hypothetical protein